MSSPSRTFSSPSAVRRVPPRFSIPPTNHEVMPGGSVNLTCVAVGAPMPFVKWMTGELELTKEDEMPIGRNVLELTNIRQSANYTCVAMSSLGMIETTAQITVKGKSTIMYKNRRRVGATFFFFLILLSCANCLRGNFLPHH